MKKWRFIIFLIIILCILLTACSKYASSKEVVITLAESSCSLYPQETYQLSYTISPAKTAVTFESSDRDVVTVDGNGVMRALKNGTATVAVSAGEYSKAYIEVTVATEKMRALPNIIFNSKSLQMFTKTEYDLMATVKHGTEVLTDCVLTWKSSNESVVQVQNGIVTARASGEALITATAKIGSETATASCAVSVYDPYKIVLDKDKVSTSIGGKFTLSAKIFDASGKTIKPEKDELEYITSDPGAVIIQGNTFQVVNIGSPSVGVRYKGNVVSIPVEIFSVKANFFSNSTKDFYGKVDGVQFCGVLFETTAYQPHLYFSQAGVDQIKSYAVANGYSTLCIHAYAILKNNNFVLNNKKWVGKNWDSLNVPISEISTKYDFWSQSEGATEVYMWFEFR